MPEPVKVNVVSYGAVKPGLVVVGNTKEGERTTIYDASTATDGTNMFYGGSSLTSWNVELPNLASGNNMFYGCSRLASFNTDLPNLTNGISMFGNCSSLPSWNVDLPNLTDGTSMFNSCSRLASFNTDLPNLTNGTRMFSNCSSLTSWNVELPNLANGTNMFAFCSSLTSWNVELPSLTNGSAMFFDCIPDASSVLRILTSIPDRAASGLAVANLHIGKRTNFKDDAEIAALLGTTAPIAAGTYSCKGWTINVQA